MNFGEDPKFLIALTGSDEPHLIFLDTLRMRVYILKQLVSL